MSAATAQARTRARSERASAGTSRARGAPGIGIALVIALIPLGVGLGVVLGRSSNNQDAKLLAAIEARRQQVVTVAAATSTPAAVSSTAAAGIVKSGFPLSSGYAIELTTLPAGSRQSAAAAAEAAARGRGATAVGLLSASDYSITPNPSAPFVVYSGAFRSRTAAERGLAKLKHSFPHALVISLTAATGGGKVVARSRFGAATQAAGYKPTQASLTQGANVANGVAKKIGRGYVGSQNNLPSVVSVP